MYSCPILLAEIDPQLLDTCPPILRESLPKVELDVCTSVDAAVRKLYGTRYDAVLTSAPFAHANDFHLLKRKQELQALTPIVVTVGEPSEGELARQALKNGAFDVMIKPLQPDEIRIQIRLAIWQNRLLRLLISRENLMTKFRQHLENCPEDRRSDQIFQRRLKMIQDALDVLDTTIVQVEKSADLVLDLAALVEQRTHQQALDRLFQLDKKGLDH